MIKYAKITNEETKECSVGLNDPDKPFSEKIVQAVTHEETIPEKTHTEVVPAEYDNDGNIIKPEETITIIDEPEQTITVIDEPEHTEIITIGDYYESIGMTKMDVEQAYNKLWYLTGYAPAEPAPTKEEQSEKREQAYTIEVDPITCHINRLRDKTPVPEDEIVELIAERDAKVEEIKERYPYPEE